MFRHVPAKLEEYIMKKIVMLIAMTLIMIMTTAAPAFAGTFSIESTTPEDGAKNTTKENLCVKIMFTTEVGNEEAVAANKDAFRIVDAKGKEFPSLIYYNKENPKYALILADTTKIPQSGDNAIKDNTEYTCILDADFRDNDGNTLGEEQKISFTTMDQGRGMIIYMVLMVGMMVAMMVMTVIQTKREAESKATEEVKEETFNPYKEAKATGKSVEQVIAEHEKEKQKGDGILGGLLGSSKPKEEEPEEKPKTEGNLYRVKKPQPISAAGSTYKTGRKAKAEAEAKKREEEKQARKAEGYTKKKSDKKETNNKKTGKKKGGKK